MSQHRSCVVILAAILIGMCGNAFAQNGAGTETKWRKTIMRNVELAAKKKDTVKLAGNKTKEITLAETLVNEIRAGRLPAYSNIDHDFSTRLQTNDNNLTINVKRDTITATDPVTNKEKTQIRVTELNLDLVHTYRTLEEWVYNPATGNTDVQITGIAPIRDVYGDDGVLRGVQAMFWLKYSDAVSYIMKYEKEHPKNTLIPRIWKDNFSDNENGDLHVSTLRTIDVRQKTDTFYRNLKDAGPDGGIADIISDEIKKGAIPIYRPASYDFGNKIPFEHIKDFLHLDTVTVLDPVSRGEIQQIRQWDNYLSNDCGIIEKWDFDATGGRITIHTIGLAGYNYTNYGNNPKHTIDILFLVKPEDAKAALYTYNQYHPAATLSNRIWDSYFLSDTKPELLK